MLINDCRGLIHKSGHSENDDNEEDSVANGDDGDDDFLNAAPSGQLTGLAQDQDAIIVEADMDARQAQQAQAQQEGEHAAWNNPEHRQLRDIVSDSLKRWQLPTADADAEYYSELKAMGYQNEELEERMQERGREYHGMLAMGCRRKVQCIPKLIRLSRVRVSAIAAGYAHTMLLSDEGQLYGAGYNDRGQLGLG